MATPARRTGKKKPPRRTARGGSAAAKLAVALRERDEAIERQTATAEILKVISSSPTDLQPVLEAVAQRAAKLSGVRHSSVFLADGGVLRRVASSGLVSGSLEMPIRRTLVNGRAFIDRRAVHVADVVPLLDSEYPDARGNQRALGFRSLLAVPLLRGGKAIGTINCWRPEVRPFSKEEIALLQTFADQAVIAIENVRLFNETREALEQQTATAEILKVIASSPTDAQPVFKVIVESAVRLCGARFGRVYRYDGSMIHMVASQGLSTPGLGQVQRVYPRPAAQDTTVGQAILGLRARFVHDIQRDQTVPPLSREMIEALGTRSQVTMPMLRAGAPIGAIVMGWDAPDGFTDKQVALLQTFADQAVIAIENVRLFNETKEALERQTATADILSVISRSVADVQPVLDALAERTAKLFGAANSSLWLARGDVLRRMAVAGERPGALPTTDLPLRRTLISARTYLERKTINIPDLVPILDSEYPDARDNQRATGVRSVLSVPLLRGDEPIGVLNVWRVEVRSFTSQEASLLESFATQAVIAIENARLFNETKEALEQQTATSDVLGVISSSPTDLGPVFDAILKNATQLCGAHLGLLGLYDGEKYRTVAQCGANAEFAKWLSERGAFPLAPGGPLARMADERRPIHIHDLKESPTYREGRPMTTPVVDLGGARTYLAVPLIKDSRVVGGLTIYRREVKPFTEKQIALLSLFANQAVIAIENVRLFNETKDALERQTATAEILRVISGSPADIQPVLRAVAESAAQLCEASNVHIRLADGEFLHAAMHIGSIPLPPGPVRISRKAVAGRAFLESRTIHLHDVMDPAVRADYPEARFLEHGEEFRTLLVVPMVRDDVAIGTISVRRTQMRPFSEQHVKMLQTFADQAVIAIENVRLFNEITDKSAQLEIANKHKSEFLANMSHELRTPLNAIIGFSEALSDRMFGEVNEKQGEYLKDIHESGRHLLSLINDILDLSKIEAGRMELELSSFHLPSALSNAITLIRERAQRHSIALGLEVDESLGEFRGDERKFKQIMLNLLSNAVKFTPDGGKVDVSAKRANGAIEVAVRDTGIGIAPEDQAVVFEEFRQVGRDRQRKAEGTGLGLALTRRFVELHGGEIRLDSTPGQGSTFSFTLPLRP